MTLPALTLQSCKLFSTSVAAWIFMVAVNPALADTKSTASIPPADLIQPADLAASLESSSVRKPLILQVGFRTMFDQSHIPGSEYAGPGNTPAGLKVLSDRIATLPKDTAIVIYCGCCPWSHCPNIAAAYDTLHEMGLTQVRVLYIADDFGTDWVDKGYPATRDK
jgi:thiosulfate/3-mercaptopyruvate sulfurtransferase